MKIDLVRQRLHNQKLVRPRGFADASADRRGTQGVPSEPGRAGAAPGQPAEIVSWLGAVQAQDYAGAKWALGQRTTGVTDADVDEAFNRGDIIRTHVLRPTWHFVTPADLRWMLALTAPRVNAVSAFYHRTFELDARVFARSQRTLERALQGDKQLTRPELAKVLLRAGIPATGLRLAYLMMHAELDQVICSGARHGKQFTYALLEERAPRIAKTLTRDESLAELTRRYFSSHGPATLRDYVWWSGLTVREARMGIDAVKRSLAQERLGDRLYWFRAETTPVERRSTATFLLPNYDEFLIAYKDRGPAGHPPGRDAFAHHLIVDGRLAGSWRRRVTKDSLLIEVAPYAAPTPSGRRSIARAAALLGKFMNMPMDARVRMGA